MKEKNFPDDNSSKSIEELTEEVNNIINQLEKEEDLKCALVDYQKLIQLNNIIEKKFQKKSKSISQNVKEKINKTANIKNDK